MIKTETAVPAPPVIATITADLCADGPLEVLVRHEEFGVYVDVRAANSGHSWTPIELRGGSFEVRTS